MNDQTAPDAQEDQAFKAEVLAKLSTAGAEGLALSRLITARQEEKRMKQRQTVEALEAAGEVQVLRRNNTVRYWAAGQMPKQQTAEEKADEVLRQALPEQRKGRLLTATILRDEILRGQGIKDGAIRTCLRILEQEGLLLKFTAGTHVYYAYTPAVRTMLGEVTPAAAAPTPPTTATSPVPTVSTVPPATASSLRQNRPAEAPLPVTNQRVIEAYRSVRMQRRLPDVEIARLQEVLHCSADELKVVVKRLCELGTFVPGKGDWSFASPASRAAAVMIQDEPHLFVRMKD